MLVFVWIMIGFLLCELNASNFVLKSRTSSIKISDGASFSIDNPVVADVGTIVTEAGSTLSGTSISFTDGIIEDKGNKIVLSGTLDVSETGWILLNGNKKFVGSRGAVYQSIYVSGANNRLEGDFLMSNDIELADANASVVLDIRSRLNSNLILNGGSMSLDEDLRLVDGKRVVGPGVVRLKDHKLSFGAKTLNCAEPLYFDNAADVEINANINLSNVWTFSGNSILTGNNNLFCLMTGGKIIVERGGSLLIKNMIMRKVNGADIFCMDDAGTFSFQNVTWNLDSDFTFSLGCFNVLTDFFISGTNKFIYTSPCRSVISDKANLILDGGLTFSYDAPQNNLLVFEDCCSTLWLRGSTLHVTSTGLHLTDGCMVVEKKSRFVSETYNNYTTGIIIGNDDQIQNFNLKVLNNSRLVLTRGTLQYRNVGDDICDELERCVILEIASGALLKLDQTLDLGSGALFISSGASLVLGDGINIEGPVNYF